MSENATPWRAVLVGCGRMSLAWMEAVKVTPGLEIVGLVDLFPAAAEKLAHDYQLQVPTGTDLDAVLAQTKANVLFVVTVPEAHRPNILSGLAHGCHVLTEKPLAENVAQGRELIAAAQKAQRTVAVIQNRRHHHGLRSLKHYLTTGKLGRLTGLDADFYIGAHFGGFREQMENVLLLDMSIHTFDMARLLAGANAVAVTAHQWNPPNSWYRHGASAAASFEFENGLVFNYRGSWCSQGFDTDWNSAWRVLGENGAVRWDGADALEAEVVGAREGFVWPKVREIVPLLPQAGVASQHTSVIQDFIRCLEAGTEPETVITDNIHSLAMVEAAIASAREQRRVVMG